MGPGHEHRHHIPGFLVGELEVGIPLPAELGQALPELVDRLHPLPPG